MTLFRPYCTHFYCTQVWLSYSKETMRNSVLLTIILLEDSLGIVDSVVPVAC